MASREQLPIGPFTCVGRRVAHACKTRGVEVDVLFAGIAVSDFGVARAWYERFFDRAADVVAHDTEVMWQITDRAWLYIVRDEGHAGNAIVAVAVADIRATTAALNARGIDTAPIAPEGDAGLKSIALDPDGNAVTILEVSHRCDVVLSAELPIARGLLQDSTWRSTPTTSVSTSSALRAVDRVRSELSTCQPG